MLVVILVDAVERFGSGNFLGDSIISQRCLQECVSASLVEGRFGEEKIVRSVSRGSAFSHFVGKRLADLHSQFSSRLMGEEEEEEEDEKEFHG